MTGSSRLPIQRNSDPSVKLAILNWRVIPTRFGVTARTFFEFETRVALRGFHVPEKMVYNAMERLEAVEWVASVAELP